MARNDARLTKLEGSATNPVCVSFISVDEEGALLSATVSGGVEFSISDYQDRDTFEAAVGAAEASRGRTVVRVVDRFDV